MKVKSRGICIWIMLHWSVSTAALSQHALWSSNDLCGVKYHNRFHMNLMTTSALAVTMQSRVYVCEWGREIGQKRARVCATYAYINSLRLEEYSPGQVWFFEDACTARTPLETFLYSAVCCVRYILCWHQTKNPSATADLYSHEQSQPPLWPWSTIRRWQNHPPHSSSCRRCSPVWSLCQPLPQCQSPPLHRPHDTGTLLKERQSLLRFNVT